ncbi:hypothetical protein [Pseudomonas maumuensis]|uniref:Uncharacterized protein n=1 Tax=Pseudomonas maumuensis TaxID=2842354 RepID=A0ABX8NFF9_9PSED|nr:hypothetical protein [Pseudomonas maumuensis]QXH55103.1 hypothetical protein KSS90_17350 [Pseudomonas maumuensis]
MNIDSRYGVITVVDEPTYTFDSIDNTRRYAREITLDDDDPSSVHGVMLDEASMLVVRAGGGGTGVHAHSALVIDDKLLLAVGNQIACVSLIVPNDLLWSRKVDLATCFGLYWAAQQRVLISHGELEITGVSLEGDIIWKAMGADIFTGRFQLAPDYVEVVDFYDTVYRFDVVSGEALKCS